MGNFSTAVFIRNEKQMTKEEFTEDFSMSMEKRGYKRATEKNGSGYVLVFSENSDWVTLERDAYESDRDALMEDAGWFSESLQTSCIGMELVDSDFATLALYARSREETDMVALGDVSGYLGDEDAPRGMKKYWEPLLKKGCTWERFQETLAGSHTYAEDGLRELGPLLGMDAGSAGEDGNGFCTALYFRKGKRTPSFDAAFKRLYAEKLAPYGFQKIKGKRPYFVRMEGDEIAHVIAYANSWACRPYKSFIVRYGVATVYRKKIDLEENPRDANWMDGMGDPGNGPYFEYRNEYVMEPGVSYQVGGNDVGMMEELEWSVEVVKQEILPKLDQVKTLEDRMEILGPTAAYVYDLDFEHECDENEGMLNYKLYTLEEFEARKKKSVESVEARYKERRTQIMKEQVAIFRKYTEDERYHQKVLEEMERRKVANQEILRGYGLKF